MLLGIDVGTSATKVVIIDEHGRTLATASAAYEVDRPRDGWTQQPPERWWAAVVDGVRRAIAAGGIDPGSIIGVGLSGQMHGSVFLDRKAIDEAGAKGCRAIRPALLWNDQRTARECAEIEAAVGGGEAIVRAVGNRALTGFTLPKLLWLKGNEPESYSRVAALALPKDYIRLQLTGTLGTDVGDASGILLIDPDRRDWNRAVCAAVGVDPVILPPLTESACIVGSVTPWAASQTGLKTGTPVAAGTGDNHAGAIGAGVAEPGLAVATLGTSGVIYVHSESPRRDLGQATPPGRVMTMCAADGSASRPGHWSITGCTLSAAGSIQWARSVLAFDTPYETLFNEAAAVPIGCEGLVFLPYLSGERCPHPDPRARGAWIGLRAHHTRAHLIRAVMEGVAFTMSQMLEVVRALPVEISRVRLGGGGNKSSLWRQMQADVYGLPCSTVSNDEGPAFGAALLAGVGVGRWASVREACRETVLDVETHEPQRDARAEYARIHGIFDPLYHQLAPTMHALTGAQQSG